MSTPTTTTAASATTSSSSASASCVSAVPGKNGYVPPSACNALYAYNPSFAAAVIFSVLFGVVTVTHIVQAISYRKVSSNFSSHRYPENPYQWRRKFDDTDNVLS